MTRYEIAFSGQLVEGAPLASVQANLAIRAETRSRKTVWTPHGIKKAKEPPSDS